MENISIGFLFSLDKKWVSLMKRKEEKSGKILLTGIGGHVDPGESFLDAMKREFIEEAGLDISTWKRYSTLKQPNSTIDIFKAFSDDIYNIQSKESDMARFYSVDSLHIYKFRYNVHYLICMALDETLINSTLIY